ncbi:MAG: protein kinase [Planctomycetes bacterium]|nr:protein kinase [Planctomycetota bacterium]
MTRALEARDRGIPLGLRELCGGDAELMAVVADALGVDAALPQMHDAALRIDPLVGVTFNGRYRLEHSLGRGAMGVVYRARDLELERDVAVKITQSIGSAAEVRFLREGRALAALSHPHVVAIHDLGRTEQAQMFLVMECLAGSSLAEILAARPAGAESTEWVTEVLGTPPPSGSFVSLVTGWAADLAGALRVTHDAGVFHRDIKPSNVFVTEGYRAVLIDFGLAKTDHGSDATLEQAVLGTPQYMAPEQARAEVVDPAAADVYGLTATLYHALAGQPPLRGEPVQVMQRLARGEVPAPIGALRPDLHRDLQAIVECGLAASPRHRYRSMSALETDLRAFLEHRPVGVRPLSPPARLWRAVLRRPQRAAAIGSAVLAVLLLGLVIPLWRTVRARSIDARLQRLVHSLPARICIEGLPDQRIAVSLGKQRQADIALLTEILELSPEHVPVLLMRSALLADSGEHARACADARRIAEVARTPYLRAMSQRYESAVRGERGIQSLDLGGLPAPITAHDAFVAGFHALRERRSQTALQLLTKATEGGFTPARDLRLLAMIAVAEGSLPQGERDRLLHEVISEAHTLEGLYGQPTARTRGMIGTALIMLGRYRDAIPPLEQSLEVRPSRHGPLQNLGVAYRRLRELDRAERYLRQALAVRPEMWNTHYELALVHSERGQVDAALRDASAVRRPGQPWFGADLEGQIHLRQATIAKARSQVVRAAAERARQAGDAATATDDEARAAHLLDLARQHAGKAQQAFRRGIAVRRDHRKKSSRIERSLVLAGLLVSEDREAAWRELLGSARRAGKSEILDPVRLFNLAKLLPDGPLSVESADEVRRFFDTLYRHLAPQVNRSTLDTAGGK